MDVVKWNDRMVAERQPRHRIWNRSTGDHFPAGTLKCDDIKCYRSFRWWKPWTWFSKEARIWTVVASFSYNQHGFDNESP